MALTRGFRHIDFTYTKLPYIFYNKNNYLQFFNDNKENVATKLGEERNKIEKLIKLKETMINTQEMTKTINEMFMNDSETYKVNAQELKMMIEAFKSYPLDSYDVNAVLKEIDKTVQATGRDDIEIDFKEGTYNYLGKEQHNTLVAIKNILKGGLTKQVQQTYVDQVGELVKFCKELQQLKNSTGQSCAVPYGTLAQIDALCSGLAGGFTTFLRHIEAYEESVKTHFNNGKKMLYKGKNLKINYELIEQFLEIFSKDPLVGQTTLIGQITEAYIGLVGATYKKYVAGVKEEGLNTVLTAFERTDYSEKAKSKTGLNIFNKENMKIHENLAGIEYSVDYGEIGTGVQGKTDVTLIIKLNNTLHDIKFSAKNYNISRKNPQITFQDSKIESLARDFPWHINHLVNLAVKRDPLKANQLKDAGKRAEDIGYANIKTEDTQKYYNIMRRIMIISAIVGGSAFQAAGKEAGNFLPFGSQVDYLFLNLRDNNGGVKKMIIPISVLLSDIWQGQIDEDISGEHTIKKIGHEHRVFEPSIHKKGTSFERAFIAPDSTTARSASIKLYNKIHDIKIHAALKAGYFQRNVNKYGSF